MQQLETERTILRAWQPDDAADMFTAFGASPLVGPMAGWKPHESVEETQEILRKFIVNDDAWAIVWKQTGRPIGSVGLHGSTRPHVTYDREIGYVLSADYWGMGIMPEVVSRVVRYAFEELYLRTLYVSHFPFNDRSRRVIEKVGFRHVGRITESYTRYDGTLLDEEVYLMHDYDYASRRTIQHECEQ